MMNFWKIYSISAKTTWLLLRNILSIKENKNKKSGIIIKNSTIDI